MVIFVGGKISRKCLQDISRGGNFHDTTLISFIKVYRFYFRVGEIFAKKTKVRITQKLPTHKNFHVYSTCFLSTLCCAQYWWVTSSSRQVKKLLRPNTSAVMDHVQVSLENPHVPTAKTATDILCVILQGGIQCRNDMKILYNMFSCDGPCPS